MRIRLLILLACLFHSSASVVRSQVSPRSGSVIPLASDYDATLRGLRGFDVEVSIEIVGADTIAIRNRAELKLRQNGIHVSADYSEYLLLTCVAVQSEDEPLVAYSCSVRVQQLVVRNVPSPLRLLATTWESGLSVATVGKSKFREAIANDVDGLVDQFLNAWYKANPK